MWGLERLSGLPGLARMQQRWGSDLSLGPSSEDPVLPHMQSPGGPGPSLWVSQPSQPWISSSMILENHATVYHHIPQGPWGRWGELTLTTSVECLLKTISMETFSLVARGIILIFSKSVFLWLVRRKAVYSEVVTHCFEPFYIFFQRKETLDFMFNRIGNGLAHAFLCPFWFLLRLGKAAFLSPMVRAKNFEVSQTSSPFLLHFL